MFGDTDDVNKAAETMAMVNVVGEEFEGQYNHERKILKDNGWDDEKINGYHTYP